MLVCCTSIVVRTKQHFHLHKVESIWVREGSASLIFLRYWGSFWNDQSDWIDTFSNWKTNKICHRYCLDQKEVDLKTLAFVWLAGKIIYLNRIVFQVDGQQWGVWGQLGHLGQTKITFLVLNLKFHLFTSLKSSTVLLLAQNSSKLVMCSRPENRGWIFVQKNR